MTKYIATRAHDFTDFNRKFMDGDVVELTADQAAAFNQIAGGLFEPLDEYLAKAAAETAAAPAPAAPAPVEEPSYVAPPAPPAPAATTEPATEEA